MPVCGEDDATPPDQPSMSVPSGGRVGATGATPYGGPGGRCMLYQVTISCVVVGCVRFNGCGGWYTAQ